MSSQFQNRLVGVIVLVALGVIFLPDILDGKKQLQEEQFAEIPLRPEIEQSNDLPQPIEPIDLSEQTAQFVEGEPTEQETAETAAVDRATVSSADKSSSSEAKETTVNNDASPAYTLQLGSFKNATNVKALVSQLRKKGFRAYTIPVKPVDGQLTKVFVGPDISKTKLLNLQKEVDKAAGVKSAIVAYNPVE
ncbi:SPOR domain-containing protein [Shewanella colwelliana]|uniref:SPOR domain-containing protein n=1 Tax=Shewanella colwelliana TaxID=23 RepID=UPI0022AFC054|nr:SPOR domain-containing protein [Shewanella colwelliana]MCZ4337074.1 SPOR domain-containing protein [Shewanella colwelliana]